MQEINQKNASILQNVSENDLNRIASTRRSTRERAINSIIASLDPHSESDKNIFQNLPLELLKR